MGVTLYLFSVGPSLDWNISQDLEVREYSTRQCCVVDRLQITLLCNYLNTYCCHYIQRMAGIILFVLYMEMYYITMFINKCGMLFHGNRSAKLQGGPLSF